MKISNTLIMFLLLLTGSVWADTHYVSSSGNNTSPYTSWATAATSIQDAIDEASSGDTVLVTNGTYSSDWMITPDYSLTNRVCITSDILVQSVNGPDVTIIDADNEMRGVYLSAGTLSGFSVINGITWSSDGTWNIDRSGGGIWLAEGTTASNCIISDCWAATGGGAFFYYGGSIVNSTLTDNEAENEGGGARGYYGGTLTSCTISNNIAGSYGGGIFCDDDDSLILNTCTIANNSAGSYGGGMYHGYANACTFSNNSGTYGGAAAYVAADNCLFDGNYGSGDGGGLFYGTANNCTFFGNSSRLWGGGTAYATIYNCIAWGNSAGTYDDVCKGSIYYTCASDVTDGENGNMTDDPCFTDADNGDYTLKSSSPCIDEGDNDYVTTDTDLAGNSRIQNSTVDMGAYEYSTLSISTASTTVSCYTDDIDISGSSSSSDGTLNWSNAATGDSGTLTLSSSSWTIDDIPLATGANTITVTLDGTDASDSVTITRAAEPTVDILTESQTLTGENDSIEISGTNSLAAIGSLTWTNATTGESATFSAETTANSEWTVSEISLEFGANILTVSGTNSLGDLASDQITITRQAQHTGESPIHYVSTNGLAVWPYTNWINAATSVQDAVDAAASNDTVMVTNGTYAAGWMITPSYSLTNRVCITNSICVQSVNGPDATILDAGGKMRGAYLTGGASLSGLTITNGITWTSDGTWFIDRSGGGLWLDESVTVSNCIISGSYAATAGGVFCYEGGALIDCHILNNSCDNEGGGVRGYNGGTLTRCTISNNSADSDGGGCYQGTLTSCTISSNTANSYGGGCYDGTQTGCTISGNSGYQGGGCYDGTQTGCTISDNSAEYFGGGCYDGTQTGCTISGNSASYQGGGCCYGTQTGCTITDNSATDGGGCCDGTQTSCTISGNSAEVGGGCYYGTLKNCIIWSNTAYGEVDNWYDGDMSYCCTTPKASGTGNITNNPCFTDADNGDYTLLSTSPCIDAGLNQDWMTNAVDIAGNDRIQNGTVDMGAYEYGTVSIETFDTTISCYTNTVGLSGTATTSSGTLSWTNTATGASGTITLSDGTWTLEDIELATGLNTLTITLDGTSYSTVIEITRASEPVVDILTESQTLTGENESITISGTNNLAAIGSLTWTNAATGESDTFSAETTTDYEWTVSKISLEFGANAITVSGTNSLGDLSSDQITITRSLECGLDSPIHYVSTNGLAVWPYTNWINAATSVQDAVDAAASNDTVMVTNGTYLLDSQIYVTNAITLQSCDGPETTIFNAQQNDRVLYLDGEVLISGFTLTNGYSSGNGGGVYCEDETCILTNCIISGNTSAGNGGGCYDCTLTGCTISGNTSVWNGGGCQYGKQTRCTISDNSAHYAGGCNYSTQTDCTISGNTAEVGGGGCCFGTQTRCTITGNSAEWHGGGCQYGKQTSCTISSNSSSYQGGGCDGGTQIGCTITGNSASDNGGGCYQGTLENCIVWSNTVNGVVSNWYSGDMSYCCTTPLPDGTGNISDDPCFTDADNGDYTLLSTSPCIDAGMDTGSTTDLAGTARPLDGDGDGVAVMDIGAYEYVNASSDSDNDGQSDGDETVTGTSLIDADDYFSVDVDGTSISFSTADGRDYTVLTCTNLVEGSWNTVTNFSGTGTDKLITDPDTDKPESFYRVQVELEPTS